MKKLITIILAVLMCVSLAACGKKGETKQSFAGKYLLTEMQSGSESYTEFLKSSWEDKSFYEYFEITEDNRISAYSVTDGNRQTLMEYYFDPETKGVFEDEEMKNQTSDVLTFEGDTITMTSGDSTFKLVKTDEIPY